MFSEAGIIIFSVTNTVEPIINKIIGPINKESIAKHITNATSGINYINPINATTCKARTDAMYVDFESKFLLVNFFIIFKVKKHTIISIQ